jgi:di/tricarboxylate transporter
MLGLSGEAWLALGVVLVIFICLSLEAGPTDALLMGGAIVFGITGIISTKEVFEGFANDGMLTVAALFVVVSGLRETGALDMVGNVLLGKTRTERGAFIRISVFVTSMSAFLNNTPIVAMMLPVVTQWCRRNMVSPSKLLIPLSYVTILGGCCTLIGTSTNLVINGLLAQAHNDPKQPEAVRAALDKMSLFDLAWVGIPCAVVGVLYLYFIGRRMLPDRRDLIERFGESVREFTVNMRIGPGCRLANQRVEQAGLRHLQGLFLMEIARADQTISPVAPDQLMQEGDILVFSGVVENIVELERIPGLVPAGDESYDVNAASRRSVVLCEAVVSNTSPLIGRSIREADFRARYNAAVVAVHRGGERLQGRIGDIVLRNGDTLLLQAGMHFARANRNNNHFVLVSTVEDSRPVRHNRAWLSIAILGVFIFFLVTEYIDTAIAAFLAAGLMIALRCINASDARRAVDYQTLVTIGASFAIGKGLTNTGAVQQIATHFTNMAGGYGPWFVLIAIYIVTLVCTELITNNAAAVLMFPFAVAFSQQLGVSPWPFVIAVTVAASNAFALPLGYQTHLMVYGPGGYKFNDFIKVGLPLDIVTASVACAVIPLFWKF